MGGGGCICSIYTSVLKIFNKSWFTIQKLSYSTVVREMMENDVLFWLKFNVPISRAHFKENFGLSFGQPCLRTTLPSYLLVRMIFWLPNSITENYHWSSLPWYIAHILCTKLKLLNVCPVLLCWLRTCTAIFQHFFLCCNNYLWNIGPLQKHFPMAQYSYVLLSSQNQLPWCSIEDCCNDQVPLWSYLIFAPYARLPYRCKIALAPEFSPHSCSLPCHFKFADAFMCNV